LVLAPSIARVYIYILDYVMQGVVVLRVAENREAEKSKLLQKIREFNRERELGD